MRKKIFSLILVCCFILPCLFMFVACKKEEKGKYDDLVANINNNQTFAKNHVSKLIDDTIKSDFKADISLLGESATSICSYSTKTIYSKSGSYDEGFDISLSFYKEDISYSVCNTSSSIDVYNIYEEDEGYESDVKNGTFLEFIECAQNFTAQASAEYYEITSVAFEFFGIQIPAMTIKVSDGKIVTMSGKIYGEQMICTFQQAQASELIGIDDAVFAEVDAIDLISVESATELDLSLFEMIDTIYCYDLDEVVLSDEVATYIADNFLFNEYDAWERVVIAE